MAAIRVSIVNESTVVSDADVRAAVPDLQTQVHRDFYPAWGIDADLAVVAKDAPIPPGSWVLAILDNSDQAGALGYHDLTAEGLPVGKVFAASDVQAGLSWTVTVSHELLEMLADPDINLTAFVENDAGGGRLYAYEVCDACEDDSCGYKIGSTIVSDFVFPAWFESFRQPGSTAFDFRGLISSPFELLAGGYIGYFDVGSGSGWQQLQAREAPRHPSAMRARVGSRRERRRTSRRHWARSTKS